MEYSKMLKSELVAKLEKIEKVTKKVCIDAIEDNCDEAKQYVNSLLEGFDMEINARLELQIDADIPIGMIPDDMDSDDVKLIIKGKEYSVSHIGLYS